MSGRRPSVRRVRGAVLSSLVALAGLAACTTGAPTAAPPTPSAAPPPAADDPFCQAAVQLGQVVADGPDVDADTATPAEVDTAYQNFGSATEPLVSALERNAPEPIKAQVDAVARYVRQAVSTKDDSPLGGIGFDVAKASIDGFMLAQCGYPVLRVTVSEHQFAGIPDTVGAGTVAIVLENTGQEPHEFDLDVIDDAASQSFRDILALPEAEGDALYTSFRILSTDPGETRTMFVTLEPHRYGVACSEAQGSTADAEGTGPPHYTAGEVDEFTVT